ncbi:hypothetical protein [Deinococcus koreensis]|nr:hypothetical protein [Deinococcus koreensis]
MRGELLFGYREGEILHVFLASSAGDPGWYAEAEREVLEVDAQVALG